MDLGLSAIALSFAAGLASIASPCVLPVVPIIVTGRADEHRARPALVVTGLAASFVAMGILTSLFGAAVGRLLPMVEKFSGILVLVFGLLLLLDINPFKRLGWLSNIQTSSRGRWSGLLLGASLGLIWIPCVGPVLSSVLAMVAAKGQLLVGVVLLFVYALGFAVPMLLLAYGSQALRKKVRAVASHPVAVRWASGLLLIAFGVLILWQGMLFIGM